MRRYMSQIELHLSFHGIDWQHATHKISRIGTMLRDDLKSNLFYRKVHATNNNMPVKQAVPRWQALADAPPQGDMARWKADVIGGDRAQNFDNAREAAQTRTGWTQQNIDGSYRQQFANGMINDLEPSIMDIMQNESAGIQRKYFPVPLRRAKPIGIVRAPNAEYAWGDEQAPDPHKLEAKRRLANVAIREAAQTSDAEAIPAHHEPPKSRVSSRRLVLKAPVYANDAPADNAQDMRPNSRVFIRAPKRAAYIA
jgi:hypothetical protein